MARVFLAFRVPRELADGLRGVALRRQASPRTPRNAAKTLNDIGVGALRTALTRLRRRRKGR